MDTRYKLTGGLINGLTGMPSGTDSTGANKNIPPEIQAIIAARKKKDTTPVWSREDGLRAIREGKMVSAVPDSTIKMAHDQWLKHIDDLGYELKKKTR